MSSMAAMSLATRRDWTIASLIIKQHDETGTRIHQAFANIKQLIPPQFSSQHHSRLWHRRLWNVPHSQISTGKSNHSPFQNVQVWKDDSKFSTLDGRNLESLPSCSVWSGKEDGRVSRWGRTAQRSNERIKQVGHQYRHRCHRAYSSANVSLINLL